MPTSAQVAIIIGSVLIAIVLVSILIALALRASRDTPARPAAPPSAELVERVRALLAQNRKIQAIKEVREHTSMSLADAKDYVERLPSTGPVPPHRSRAGLSPAARDRARELIGARKYVQAVKIIRDDTGWPLREAKEEMDRLRALG